jgi:UDP-GlcNAc:undecaprenyl-phosphate GlcNAc-1-phosphate transferase
MRFTNYFPTILGTVIISWLISPIAIWIASRIGLIDHPGTSQHKLHDRPTPMAGGLVIIATFLILAVWLQWISLKTISGIILGTGVIFLFGILDDRRGFAAPQKLLGQFLATAILILTGTQVRLFSENTINLALTIFWVVGLVNAFNFVDSMDGLALGIAGVASAFFLLVTIESAQSEFASLTAVMLGTSIGLYFYNLSPAKLFLGDSGAQQLGFLMAAIGVGYNPIGLQRINSWFVPILVLGLPIFDTALVVYSRWRRGAKIYQAAKDHTYHRLCGLGLEPTRTVFAMHMVGVILGFTSFIALQTPALVGNAIFASAVFIGILVIVILEKRATFE